jgi:hypothetical protein
VITAGCSAMSADDREVIKISHEGFDKVANHLKEMNSAQGSELDYHLSSVQQLAREYNAKLAPLNPKSENEIKLKEVTSRFFTNAELWAQNYQKYKSTGLSTYLDIAGSYKAKMMNAVDDINDLDV